LKKEDRDQIIAYKLSSFSLNSDQEMDKVIQEGIDSGAKYMIIDLRDNGGGYLNIVVDMLKKLLPEGNLVTLRDKHDIDKVYTSDLQNPPFKLAVLTNGNSASASEIFAAAVKDTDIGVIIGERTYGKGVAQQMFEIDGEYLVKITSQEFFSRKGHKINGIGVEPDILVDVPENLRGEQRYFSGDEAKGVKDIEGMLRFLGYFDEEADEVYDQATYKAVYHFQKDNGLYPYGVCDYVTQDKMNRVYSQEKEGNDLQLNAAIDWIMNDMALYGESN